jgi:hypothetical protein
MPTYYFTVGLKYEQEPHPLGWNPDGWIEVEATDHTQARNFVFSVAGQKWAFDYVEQPDPHLYPIGCTHKYKA